MTVINGKLTLNERLRKLNCLSLTNQKEKVKSDGMTQIMDVPLKQVYNKDHNYLGYKEIGFILIVSPSWNKEIHVLKSLL